MEDWGGISLSHYAAGHPLPMADVLAIALQLVEALHQLALHQTIHQAIHPTNILIHPKSKQIKLIDFSSAKKVNYDSDYQTDFYALGVTLHELLTGQCFYTVQSPESPLDQIIAKLIQGQYNRARDIKRDLEQLAQPKDPSALLLSPLLKATAALYRDIDLDQISSVLTQTIIEYTGADKVALFLMQDEELAVAVQYFDQAMQCPLPPKASTSLPTLLIQSVQQSLETVVQPDHASIGADPYFAQFQPQSLLCTPILNQGKLIGALYLENSTMQSAFTSDRIEVVKLLCAHAAISLSNAALYQAVRCQEAQYRSIFEAVSDGLAICDLETGMILAANPVYCQMFGYTHTEILQLHPTAMIPLESQAIFADFLAAMAAGRRFSAEAQGLRRDRSIFPIDVRSVPFTYQNRPCGLALLRDTSDRKRTEVELKQAQFQMIQNEKMSALGSLISGVAHEINNPVGFLKGNLQPALGYIGDLFRLLDCYEQHCPDPRGTIAATREAIDLEFLRQDLPNLISSMRDGIERIQDISTSLRTFSRSDSDKPVQFNLHDGLDSTLMILKHRLKASITHPMIQVVKHYGELPLVECFAGQLNQVFMNILSNAIDALHESPIVLPCITITTRADSAQVYITLSDNGLGIPDSIKDQIFDNLFTTKAVGKGTGLGLAIAQQIVVQKHGGSLTVRSCPGEGAEFTIALPIDAR
jgi:PAS domain S-box-containing protein